MVVQNSIGPTPSSTMPLAQKTGVPPAPSEGNSTPPEPNRPAPISPRLPAASSVNEAPAHKVPSEEDRILSREFREQPQVIPYDPSRPELIASKMREMKSADVNTRVRAFNFLRDAPDSVLERAWREARQAQPPLGFEMDCLERLHVDIRSLPIKCKRAIVTIATKGFETMVGSMIQGVQRYGDTDAKVIVFADADAGDFVRRHHPAVIVVPCVLAAPPSAAVKAVLYSCARWVEADTILALEADTLILSPLEQLFRTVENLRPGVMAGCRSQVMPTRFDLTEVFGHMACPESDWEWLTGEKQGVHGKFSFNGGLLCGSRSAFQAVDTAVRQMGPRGVLWAEGAFYEGFRDEFLMNICYARSGDTAELPPAWNVQFCDAQRRHWMDTEVKPDGMHYTRLGETAKVLHFVGAQRRFMPEILDEIEKNGLSAAHKTHLS